MTSKPFLIAISGPLEGKSFSLDSGRFTIGRQSDNDLAVPAISVSRRHCRINREEDAFYLTDLDSRHGTFVDELPVRRRRLQHGDVLSLGGSSFLFLLQESASEAERKAQAPLAVTVSFASFSAQSTVEITAKEAVERQTQRLLGALEKSGRVASELKAILDIANASGGCRSAAELGRRILGPLASAVQADRAALLLLDSGNEEFVCVQALDRSGHGAAPFAVSGSLLRQASSQGKVLLCRNLGESEWLNQSESLHGAGVSSLMCAPLTDDRRKLGLLYVDCVGQGEFSESHLQLLGAAAEIVAQALANARYVQWLERERLRLQEAQVRHGMVGESPPMLKIFDLISRLSPSASSVLIRGESGTGKDLAAQAIHAASPRSQEPFVALNCAALPETLIDSELFGHEKGAFTGAAARRIGKIEAAHKGTLFLDELGELPLSIQSKVLRALETKEFERLGSNRTLRSDFRLIAATNRDLEKAIEEGQFRQDLYFRLNVISFEMPPLRKRRQDIALLAQHFSSLHCKRLNRTPLALTPESARCLKAYAWPGNVRELSNAVERAAVLAVGDSIRPEDLPESVLEASAGESGSLGRYHEALHDLKRRLIIEAVEKTQGNVTKAAAVLGLHPNYLHRLVRSMGLKQELG